jgi:hypothetical protein
VACYYNIRGRNRSAGRIWERRIVKLREIRATQVFLDATHNPRVYTIVSLGALRKISLVCRTVAASTVMAYALTSSCLTD